MRERKPKKIRQDNGKIKKNKLTSPKIEIKMNVFIITEWNRNILLALNFNLIIKSNCLKMIKNFIKCLIIIF